MVEPVNFRARRRVTYLTWALTLLLPSLALAQSGDLVRSYQNFEAAKTSGKVADALKAGDEALRLTEQSGDQPTQIELLRSLGDFAAQAGQDSVAAEYYGRALELQQSALGAEHPDLVPVLTALADLKLKVKDYAPAAAFEQRVLTIERRAYGEQHENVRATEAKLREIYRSSGDLDAIARLDAESKAPASVLRGLPAVGGLMSGNNRRYKANQGFATVKVLSCHGQKY